MLTGSTNPKKINLKEIRVYINKIILNIYIGDIMAAEIKNSGVTKELVRDAVTRTLKSRIEEINQKSNSIYESMKYFEKKYGMKTEEFYKKFVRGELGDEMDFFEWKASSDIFNELAKEKRVLIEAV
jgi:hypothetical protein